MNRVALNVIATHPLLGIGAGASPLATQRAGMTPNYPHNVALMLGAEVGVAGGLLWVYNPGGGLNVYTATSGKLVGTLASGGGHWNSPIVVDGRVALPEGNANDHSTSGVLDIWRLG